MAPPSDSAETVAQAQHPSWEKLESMDWQLWMLAILLILVLGAGLLSFMFPAVFLFSEGLSIRAPQRAFFGFSVLLALALVYLLQKQRNLRELKRELVQAQLALAAAERAAAVQLFETLPGMGQFRDTLAMEYRRASTAESNLAVLLFTAPNAKMEVLGRLTRQLRSMMRQGETLYKISDMAVGVILPGMKLSDGMSFAAHVENLCARPEQQIESTVTAYPEEAESLSELEGKIRGTNKGR